MLFLHETCNRKKADEEEWYSQNLQFFLRSEGRFVDARQLVVVQLPVGRTRNAVTTGEAQQKRKEEKSNQWTEKSRNDGTHGADLFPRCRVSSDSVCSLSTLGQLHDFPLPQNAAKNDGKHVTKQSNNLQIA
jgi:hypothetical protein